MHPLYMVCVLPPKLCIKGLGDLYIMWSISTGKICLDDGGQYVRGWVTACSGGKYQQGSGPHLQKYLLNY